MYEERIPAKQVLVDKLGINSWFNIKPGAEPALRTAA
jgi:hypothetical protein